MARKAITKAQAEVIDALAHHMVVGDIGHNVKGMDGYLAHYTSRVQTAKQRQYVDALARRIRDVRKDLAKGMEDENGTSK